MSAFVMVAWYILFWLIASNNFKAAFKVCFPSTNCFLKTVKNIFLQIKYLMGRKERLCNKHNTWGTLQDQWHSNLKFWHLPLLIQIAIWKVWSVEILTFCLVSSFWGEFMWKRFIPLYQGQQISNNLSLTWFWKILQNDFGSIQKEYLRENLQYFLWKLEDVVGIPLSFLRLKTNVKTVSLLSLYYWRSC